MLTIRGLAFPGRRRRRSVLPARVTRKPLRASTVSLLFSLQRRFFCRDEYDSLSRALIKREGRTWRRKRRKGQTAKGGGLVKRRAGARRELTVLGVRATGFADSHSWPLADSKRAKTMLPSTLTHLPDP